MSDPILAVLTRARSGREEDMIDWYAHIHQHDALRFRGSTTAQLFRWSKEQLQGVDREALGWHLLALYDAFDPERWTQEHLRYFGSEDFVVSKAVDSSSGMNEFIYWPLQLRDNQPDIPHRAWVVFEQMNPIRGKEVEFERWYGDQYLPAAVRRPGVRSGGFYVYRPRGQMLSFKPKHTHVAVYRTDDVAALAGWRSSTALASHSAIDLASLSVTHWEAVNDRLTKDDVQHPAAAFLGKEEAARARIANDAYPSPFNPAEAWRLAALDRTQRASRQAS